jgi:U6 snRNA-associated Sm-like protein LSm7
MSRNHAVGSSPAGRGGGGASAAGAKKESILELQKLLDASVRVKCIGGRELEGTLRGYDDLVNLVLDDCEEYVRGTETLSLSGRRGCPDH